MAKFPHTNHHLATVLLLVFLLLISSSSSSSARLLNHFNPTLNLALPSDMAVAEKEDQVGHVSPCDHMRVAGKLPSPGTRLAGGKYGPLILNMLPRGPVPPSGPSTGIHNLKN